MSFDRNIFYREMEHLRLSSGNKWYFTDAELDTLYQDLSIFDEKQFLRITKQVRENETFKPGLSDFLKYRGSNAHKEKLSCGNCIDGVITYVPRQSTDAYHYEYGALCSCKAGEKLASEYAIDGLKLPWFDPAKHIRATEFALA